MSHFLTAFWREAADSTDYTPVAFGNSVVIPNKGATDPRHILVFRKNPADSA